MATDDDRAVETQALHVGKCAKTTVDAWLAASGSVGWHSSMVDQPLSGEHWSSGDIHTQRPGTDQVAIWITKTTAATHRNIPPSIRHVSDFTCATSHPIRKMAPNRMRMPVLVSLPRPPLAIASIGIDDKAPYSVLAKRVLILMSEYTRGASRSLTSHRSYRPQNGFNSGLTLCSQRRNWQAPRDER